MEDDDKTPEPTTEPKPDPTPTPEPVPDPAPAHDDLRDTVHALSEKVSLLQSTVEGLIPENRDESPVKRPWTHRKFGG